MLQCHNQECFYRMHRWLFKIGDTFFWINIKTLHNTCTQYRLEHFFISPLGLVWQKIINCCDSTLSQWNPNDIQLSKNSRSHQKCSIHEPSFCTSKSSQLDFTSKYNNFIPTAFPSIVYKKVVSITCYLVTWWNLESGKWAC